MLVLNHDMLTRYRVKACHPRLIRSLLACDPCDPTCILLSTTSAASI